MPHSYRTISMILTLPDTKGSIQSQSYLLDELNGNSFLTRKNLKPLSIPIYHGSIIRIERHHDNPNLSDLIIRIPNFRHLSLPSIHLSNTNTTTNDQINETEPQQAARKKRRAPICPILNKSHHRASSPNQEKVNESNNLNRNSSELKSHLIDTKRLTIGLRNITRAFVTNCKSKESTNVNQITIIPVLPDVEVITENFQIPALAKKSTKTPNAVLKIVSPKILFIKRKHFKTKKKLLSKGLNGIEVKDHNCTNENSPSNIIIKDTKLEQQTTAKQTTSFTLNNKTEQHSTTIENFISEIPISVVNPESVSSTQCHSTISRAPSDPTTIITDVVSSTVETSTNATASHVFVSNEKDNLTTQTVLPSLYADTDDNVDDRLYIVHPNGDTYSECYEVTYELDPEYQHRLDRKRDEQIHLNEIKDTSAALCKIDRFRHEDSISKVTDWSSIVPIGMSNDYNQFENMNFNRTFQDSSLITMNKPRVKFHSFEDMSPINNESPSTIYQNESTSITSVSQDNNQSANADNTPVVYEDYTIILKILKNVLQIDELFQTNTTNELEEK